MTSSAQVVQLFETQVFNHSSIVAVSPNVLTYDIVRDSEPELDRLYHQQEISFWVLLVGRGEVINTTGPRELIFDIAIQLFREKDTSGDNWKAVRDGIDALTDRVAATLYNDSGGLFDYLEVQSGPPTIQQQNEFETQVWRGLFTYRAFKIQ